MNALQTDYTFMALFSYGSSPEATAADPIAVVDIGSNTVRLVIYDGGVRTPFALFNEKIDCGLGRSLTDNGSLPSDSVEHALKALKRFRALCQRFKANRPHVLATAAVRDASDGPDFIARAEEAIGAKVKLLTGEHEAELALNAIHMGFVNPDGICGDMGGGSLELVRVSHGEAHTPVSLQLGGLRMIDRSNCKLATARSIIRDDLSGIDWLASGTNSSFYAIGGTWRVLARLHMDYADVPIRMVQGYRVKASDMIAFCGLILEKDPEIAALIETTKVSQTRLETLPYGASLMRELIKKIAPADIRFSAYGIREGLLYSFLTTEQKAKDPLLAFCEDFARVRSRSYDYAIELCDWTDRIFKAADVTESASQRRLRYAACLLCDVEWRAQREHRGELALHCVAHAPAVGIDDKERLCLALTVYHCHTNKDANRKSDLSALLHTRMLKEDYVSARRVAAAVRTAHMLSAGLTGVIGDVAVTCKNGTLTLGIPAAHADLNGKQLEKYLSTLAKRLGLKSFKVVVQS